MPKYGQYNKTLTPTHKRPKTSSLHQDMEAAKKARAGESHFTIDTPKGWNVKTGAKRPKGDHKNV